MLNVQGMEFEEFLSSAQIKERVAEVAQEMQNDFKDQVEAVIFLTVLEGSMRFSAELMNGLDFPMINDSIKLKSYQGTERTDSTKKLMGLKHNIQGRDVIIIEDIVDTGDTYHELLKILREMKPRSIRMCTLLLKPGEYKYDYPLDYVGFEIGNKFVIGYGLDYEEEYRNLDGIHKLIS